MNRVELIIIARDSVTKALRDGTLVRPQLCEICNQPQQYERVLEGHHDDYTKALEVLWLCYPCHRNRHILTKGM